MDNVSFQSRIRFVSNTSFDKKVYAFGKENFVDLPWTLKESVVSDKVYTKAVSACSACIITDGIKALMMHICPKTEHIKDFFKIESFVKETFSNKLDKLKAFLIGSMDYEMSLDLNNKFKDFLTKNKIPFTHISKGSALGSDVAYSVRDDELTLSNFLVSDEDIDSNFKSKELIDCFFKECKINALDEIV